MLYHVSVEKVCLNNDIDNKVTNRFLTIPNVISAIRIFLIPVFFVLLFNSQKTLALVVFAISAFTDFLDGQIARRFNCVSKLGQILDPAVDTLLMVSGVVGTWLFCSLPTWVMIVVFLREAFVLIAGALLIRCKQIRIPVVYLGKIATALLFFGICLLFLNEFGIWFVYAGVILQIVVTIYYSNEAYKKLKSNKQIIK